MGCAVSARCVFSRRLGDQLKQQGAQVPPSGGGGGGPRVYFDRSGHEKNSVKKDGGDEGRGGGLLVDHQVAAFVSGAHARDRGILCGGGGRVGG